MTSTTNTTLFMPVHTNDEEIDFALITLTPEDITTLQRLQAVHTTLHANLDEALGDNTTGKYSEFEFLTFGTGLTPDWYTYPPDTHDDLQDALDDGEASRVLPEPPTGLPEPERTAGDSLHVDRTSFWFTAFLKHGDDEFCTHPVAFTALNGITPNPNP
jgi:hypothetical protein